MADVAATNGLLSVLLKIFPNNSGKVFAWTKIIFNLGLASGIFQIIEIIFHRECMLEARGDCERPCFDQLNAHILYRLLFC